MEVVLFFLLGIIFTGGGLAVMLYRNKDPILNTYADAARYEVERMNHDKSREDLKHVITMQSILLNQSFDFMKEAKSLYGKPDSSPKPLSSPISLSASENAKNGRTDEGTDGRTKVEEVILEKKVATFQIVMTSEKAKNFGRAEIDKSKPEWKIKFLAKDYKVFWALFPYEDSTPEELQFSDINGLKIPFYTGLCGNEPCYNIFVTSEQKTKYCSDACRKAGNR